MKHKNIAFLFPGQGAQYCGMGKDFFDNFSVARETFEEAEDLLKMNLIKITFEGPENVLTETKHSQVAIFVNSIAVLRAIRENVSDIVPKVCAGLSLGEYTALCASGKLSFDSAVDVVRRRAQYMNDACEETQGAMAVVLGLSAEEVELIVSEVDMPEDLWAANFNCPGQVVLSGTQKGIERGTECAKAHGAKRVMPLQVHGAFHSGLMASAQEKLAPYIAKLPLVDTDIGLVSNVTGDFVHSIDEIRNCLVKQVTGSVRWEQGIKAIEMSGVDSYIEIGCGKVLSGLNKRIGVKSPTFNVDKVGDIDAIASMVETCA